MSSAVVADPILCSPFAEPDRHHVFAAGGITDEIASGRRPSTHLTPVPEPKKTPGTQPLFSAPREDENRMINDLRELIRRWRDASYPNASAASRTLLAYWRDPDRERRLFFAQVEAVETAIYLAEVARGGESAFAESTLAEVNDEFNAGLPRVAHKMATATGKTVVMAMLIAWHTLNKQANPQSRIHTDRFLVITPGLTIRDRLRVLLPSDPDNYYAGMDLVPPDKRGSLGAARIVITNYHAFQARARPDVPSSAVGKAILSGERGDRFLESPPQIAKRVLGDLGDRKSIVVINDEAHHCYRPSTAERDGAALSVDEREELERREDEARVWFSGLELVRQQRDLRRVHDLSATPFFLKGSGYREGRLFPWVVSDFPLIDAIESGLTKIPRVPVDDTSPFPVPTFRDLWVHVRDGLPKRGRAKGHYGPTGEPLLPATLEGALISLYNDYERSFERWEQSGGAAVARATPPVLIVVCNNTAVSKLVFDWIAGWQQPDGTVIDGRLRLLSNNIDGAERDRPMSILVDSRELDAGEMSPAFKKVAAEEIGRFKEEYEQRFGRSAEAIGDGDLLREVMNTVGSPGTLGGRVRCVVSVSMLTEGWNANSVTHILGVRAFGTQLLCEQVVGRALRRRSYAVDDTTGLFTPEYAEVYGVPFSFIPTDAPEVPPPEPREVVRVRALPERKAAEVRFPIVVGYRYEIPDGELVAAFGEDSKLRLDSTVVPTETDIAGILGEGATLTLEALRTIRLQTISFEIAKRLLDEHFSDATDGSGAKVARPWLFPQLLAVVERWIAECLVLADGAFPQMLALSANKLAAVEKIRQSIAVADRDEQRLVAVLAEGATSGTTAVVDFDTTKAVWATDPAKCHVDHVIADTKVWEQSVARSIERLSETIRYCKNERLGFTVPYVLDGNPRLYHPDFIVELDDGRGPEDPLHLIVEVSGRRDAAKRAKVAAARNLWVPGVNALGSEGRWAFCEIDDPDLAQQRIRDGASLEASVIETGGDDVA